MQFDRTPCTRPPTCWEWFRRRDLMAHHTLYTILFISERGITLMGLNLFSSRTIIAPVYACTRIYGDRTRSTRVDARGV